MSYGDKKSILKLAIATKTNLDLQICGLIDIGHDCFQLPFGD
jgi:hypothetical protein